MRVDLFIYLFIYFVCVCGGGGGLSVCVASLNSLAFIEYKTNIFYDMNSGRTFLSCMLVNKTVPCVN